MKKINYRLDEEKLPSYSIIKAATEGNDQYYLKAL